MKLWHCHSARSLRPLWALEELGLDFELEVLPFPPRFFKREFLEDNALGTIPYFVDGDLNMTESAAICQYLEDQYGDGRFGVPKDHPEYGNYLNWLHHSDATLTFPQTIFFRYSALEPEERRNPQVAQDYRKWYLARLKRLNSHLETREYLCDDRFTMADIAVGYALFFGKNLGLSEEYTEATNSYLERLTERVAFKKAMARTEGAESLIPG